MSTLRQKISAALKDAMRNGDQLRIGTLRLMLAALKDREIALRTEEGQTELGQAEAMALLSRMVRQREESISTYEQAARMELAERERAEIAVIREFLPKPLTTEEAEQAVQDAIRETGAASIRDMGKVMARLKARYPGRMDFAEASRRVKTALD